MTSEEQRLRDRRHQRMARAKWWLRRMPRRSTMHRYPLPKRLVRAALRRPHLWTFRSPEAMRAITLGSVLAFMPVYGIQLPLAVLAAFVFRANLPIMFALQWLTNPVTFVPVYYAAFQIGRILLGLVGVSTASAGLPDFRLFLEAFPLGDWLGQANGLWKLLGPTLLGGLAMGMFVGSVGSLLYRLMAYEVAANYRRLQDLQRKRLDREPGARAETAAPMPPNEAKAG